MVKIVKAGILLLMILNGLLFISNIYVLGDREAAIEMHDDLAPTASSLMANAKVVICFVVGVLYVVSAFAIIKKKYYLSLSGVIGFVLFVGFYILELILWSQTHPRVWIDFSIFGGFSLLFGIYSWLNWRIKSQVLT